MLSFINGRGIFIFSDPGGAKPILSLIHLLKLTNCKIISDRVYGFYNDFNIDVDTYEAGDEIKIFSKYKPQFIFTGTSYTSKIELKFIFEARLRNIKTFSFIDHYTSFSERFLLSNKYVLPETIFVTDEKSKKIAQSSSVLKKLKVNVLGNYYHKYLKNWHPTIEKKFFFSEFNYMLEKKIILFAPDPLSNLINKDFEFNENDVLKDVIKSFNKLGLNESNYFFIVKVHPNQKKEFILKLFKKVSKKNYFFTTSMDTKHLIYYSDIIIGMFSSLLIEATYFKKNIIRHLPKAYLKDPLENQKIGEVTNNINDLVSMIKKYL